MKIIKKDGWQCWVEIHDNYVIKKIKSKKEISEKIIKYLDWIGKPEELEERTNKMLEDIKTSTKIIKKSKIPKELLANPKFLKEGKIKQTRAIVLEDALTDRSYNAKKLIDKSVKFYTELWKYKIHEKTFKVHSNLGVLNDKIVLIDLFELTNDFSKVKKQIIERKWKELDRYKNRLPNLLRYFIKQTDKYWTVDNLNKNWGMKK